MCVPQIRLVCSYQWPDLVTWDDMITRLDTGHAFTYALYYASCFVTENRWEKALRICRQDTQIPDAVICKRKLIKLDPYD